MMPTFYQHLQYETAHLTTLAVGSGMVIYQRDVFGTLNHAVEIVGIDGSLVVYGSQAVGFSHAIGNERCVIESARYISFVA